MEMLSEHQYEGWLEGYSSRGDMDSELLQAFITSSFDVQPAREVAEGHREPAVAASDCVVEHLHTARLAAGSQRHARSGFVDHVMNKKAEIVRVYLPPDANCLLSVMDTACRPPLRQRGDRGQTRRSGGYRWTRRCALR
jgi:xylulose-5-phosphate/fructose-6-phosphate phosphoketolase